MSSPFDMGRIMKMCIEEQAVFCDSIVASAIDSQNDFEFLEDLRETLEGAPEIEEEWDLDKLILSFETNLYFGDWNVTSVGNIAALALNSKNGEVKKAAVDLLSKFNAYMAPLIAEL